MSRAQELLTKAITREGEAVDIAVITAVLSVVTDLIVKCRQKGTSQQQIAGAIRAEDNGSLPEFARKLRRKLGKEQYKAIGGLQYARQVFARARQSSYADVRAFVKESLS